MSSCSINTRSSGTVGGANITSITVTCASTGCGRFSSGATGSWTTVATPPTTYGLSGYLPAGGATTIYVGDSTALDDYLTASNSYTAIATPPVGFPSYWSAAWFGNALWGITSGDVIRYDIPTNTWTTPTSGLTTKSNNQTTNDDAGNLWSYQSEAVLLEYNIALGTTTTHTLTTALTGSEPRIVYDSCSGLLYLTDYYTLPLYSYNPGTGTQTTLSSLPVSNYFMDGFCDDRSGHIYAVTDVSGGPMYQYTIATSTWVAMPSGGPSGGYNSSCGIGADGYLYATDPGVSSGALFRIQLN